MMKITYPHRTQAKIPGVLRQLSNADLIAVLTFIRDWNTNSRHWYVVCLSYHLTTYLNLLICVHTVYAILVVCRAYTLLRTYFVSAMRLTRCCGCFLRRSVQMN